MKRELIKDFDVPFKGFKLGEHQLQWQLNQAFFDFFEVEQEFKHPSIIAKVDLLKSTTMLEFKANIEGKITVACDLTTDEFDLTLQDQSTLVVKFGQDYNTEDDEIWIIPHAEYQINLAQWLYEITLLAIPKKRIHPSVQNGQSDSEILQLLQKMQPKQNTSNQETPTTDPRWEALKKLNHNK